MYPMLKDLVLPAWTLGKKRLFILCRDLTCFPSQGCSPFERDTEERMNKRLFNMQGGDDCYEEHTKQGRD